jgi:hypothetical protein
MRNIQNPFCLFLYFIDTVSLQRDKLDFRVELLQTNDVIIELCVSDSASPQGGASGQRIERANNVGSLCLVYTGTTLRINEGVTGPVKSLCTKDHLDSQNAVLRIMQDYNETCGLMY